MLKLGERRTEHWLSWTTHGDETAGFHVHHGLHYDGGRCRSEAIENSLNLIVHAVLFGGDDNGEYVWHLTNRALRDLTLRIDNPNLEETIALDI